MNQKQIFELIEKFEDSRLTELSVESEQFSITLKSECAPPAMPVAAYTAPIPAAAPAPAAPAPAASQPAAQPAAPAAVDTEFITSPVVGTFYRSPAPDAPAFVEEGSVVGEGDSICIIEAMKIMNDIPAGKKGVIREFLVIDHESVEYGQPIAVLESVEE